MYNQRYKALINLAYQEALASSMHSRHGAVLFTNKKKVCSKSCNKYGGKILGFDVPSCHAEACCIEKYKRKNYKKYNNINILVLRIDINGNLMDSTPCLLCVNLMKTFGIKKVFYSNKEGDIACKNVCEINDEDTYFCHGLRSTKVFDLRSDEKTKYARLPLTPTQKNTLKNLQLLM